MKLPLRKNIEYTCEFTVDLAQHLQHTWCNSQALLDVQYCLVNDMFILHMIGFLITSSTFSI